MHTTKKFDVTGNLEIFCELKKAKVLSTTSPSHLHRHFNFNLQPVTGKKQQ